MLQKFKSEIKVFLVVVAASVVLAVGGIFLLRALNSPESERIPTVQRTSSSTEEISIKESSGTFSFHGEVSKGETFEKILDRDLVFRLNPTRDDIGWIISIEPKVIPDQDSSWNFAGIVTPPYRGGVNHIYIEGWHFRNSDNSGPNELGSKNVNAPGDIREFFFVLNPEDYREAQRALDKMLWPGNWSEEEVQNAKNLHEKLPKGVGKLTIKEKEMELGNLIIGERPWIERMEFEVEITFPPTDTSTWQTYRNDEFGFEVKYSPIYRTQEIAAHETYPELNYEKHISSFKKGFRFLSQKSELYCSTLEVLLYEKENNTRDVWLQKNSGIAQGFGRREDVILNGIPSYFYTYPAGDLVPGNMYILDNEHYIFQINILGGLSGYEPAVECGSILSTFRFTP